MLLGNIYSTAKSKATEYICLCYYLIATLSQIVDSIAVVTFYLRKLVSIKDMAHEFLAVPLFLSY